MRAEAKTPTSENRVALDALYPGPWAPLLVELCHPTQQHKHAGQPCESPGKAPVRGRYNADALDRYQRFAEGGLRDAHLDRIARHLDLGRGNVGLVLPSPVCMLDPDSREATAELARRLGPDHPMQETGRGGHFPVLVELPEGVRIARGTRVDLGGGLVLDIKSPGQHIAVSPSTHASGAAYCWKVPLPALPGDLPAAPPWLVEALVEAARRRPRGSATLVEGERNKRLFEIGCAMRGRDESHSTILEELLRVNGDPELTPNPVDDAEVRKVAQSVMRYAPDAPGLDAEPEGAAAEEREAYPEDARGQRPTIGVAGRHLDDLIRDAVRAFQRANDPPSVFLRGRDVVAVHLDADGRPLVAELRDVDVRDRLAPAAVWQAGRKPAGPSRDLAALVRARLARSPDALPPLRGVTASPLLLRDGSLLARPGYDAESGIYLAPPPGFAMPPVPEHPSAADVEKARELLCTEVLGDFPFVAQADRATALALPLSLVLREIAGRGPLTLMDSPAAGTGKKLCVDAVVSIATGAAPPAVPEPEDDAEWSKKLTSALLAGRSVTVFDNIERPIGSGALAAFLTTDTWGDRVLGLSKDVELPNRLTLIATGNNLSLRGDLPRRSVWCRLDARRARAWQRSGWHHDALLAWVAEHRAELLAALLVLGRAWIDAGRPGPEDSVPTLGSFDSWRQNIGGVLRVAGVTGFLGNVEALYDRVDEDTPAWTAFLAVWRACFGDRPVRVAELLDSLRSGAAAALRESLPDEIARALDTREGSAAKRIGRALLRKAETRFPVDGGRALRLVRGADRVAHVVAWRVVEE